MADAVTSVPRDGAMETQEVPSWVSKMAVSATGVVAYFPPCSCGRDQEKMRYGKGGGGRTIDEAKTEVLQKVRSVSVNYCSINISCR